MPEIHGLNSTPIKSTRLQFIWIQPNGVQSSWINSVWDPFDPSLRQWQPLSVEDSLLHTHTHKLMEDLHPDSMTTWRFAQGSKSGRVHLKGSAPERSLSDPQTAQAKCLTREEKLAITMTLLALTNDCGGKELRLPCPFRHFSGPRPRHLAHRRSNLRHPPLAWLGHVDAAH